MTILLPRRRDKDHRTLELSQQERHRIRPLAGLQQIRAIRATRCLASAPVNPSLVSCSCCSISEAEKLQRPERVVRAIVLSWKLCLTRGEMPRWRPQTPTHSCQ